MASSAVDPSRPLSVKEISDKARAFDWNTNIPLKAWLRTAHTLSHEGEIYMREGSFGQAYLLYLRYSILILDLLKTHPDVKTTEGKNALRASLMTVDVVLSNLERIKPVVQRQHEEWVASEAQERQRREKQQAERNKTLPQSTYEKHASRDPALSSARLLDAGEYQDLAVDLARKEIQRRDANKRATRKAGLSAREEQHRRIAGFWDNWTDELAEKQAEDESTFRKHMQSTRQRFDEGEDGKERQVGHRQIGEARPTAPPYTRRSTYHYPSISKPEPLDYESARTDFERPRVSQPPLPAKVSFSPANDTGTSIPIPTRLPPAVPAKESLYREEVIPTPEQSPSPLPAVPSKLPENGEALLARKQQQQRTTFKPSAYLENGEPLRTIFLPGQLRNQFLSIASDNTKRGLEMCGILCGTPVNNALFVRCLLIPEQRCTSDTCETVNEGAMSEYCINEDLYMLGWIHTHPTQTCFMSSRDLHTQLGYQAILPESIAIVCAPKFQPSYGIFRLTNPPGLPHIRDCTQSATFHQHAIDNLYTDAGHPPGHVYETDKLEFYVHDLRPGANGNGTWHGKKF